MLNLTAIHRQHGIFCQDDSASMTILDLQTTINSRVPNRVVKVALGFELWREAQKRPLLYDDMMDFIQDFLEKAQF